MLTYSRIKSIGVQMQSRDRRVVSGVLEDELADLGLGPSVIGDGPRVLAREDGGPTLALYALRLTERADEPRARRGAERPQRIELRRHLAAQA